MPDKVSLQGSCYHRTESTCAAHTTTILLTSFNLLQPSLAPAGQYYLKPSMIYLPIYVKHCASPSDFYARRCSHILDSDFLYKNPDYNQLIGFINTEAFDYLDFSMPPSKQIDLFKAGAVAAVKFLRGCVHACMHGNRMPSLLAASLSDLYILHRASSYMNESCSVLRRHL